LSRVLAALCLLLALAGCAHGSKDHPARAKSRPSPAEPPARDPSLEPLGRLSGAEYRAIVHEYRLLKPLENGDDDPASLRRGARVCAELQAPPTVLVGLVRADCDNAIAFFASLRDLEHAGDDCGSGSQSDRLNCARQRYTKLAAAIKRTSAGAARINAELRQRGISGLCARSIGITESQLAAYRRAEQAARDGADALAVGDSEGLQRATDELTRELSGGGGEDPLRGIERGCSVAKRKPLPRVPSGNGISA
jgi:hypothetical protein